MGSLPNGRQLPRLLLKKLLSSVDMSNRQELCNSEAQAPTTVFRTKCIVNGHPTEALIDSGASGMFISGRFVQRYELATRKKKDGGYELMAVDGSSLPDVDSETMPLPLVFQQHHEEIVLDIVPMARHDVVLGVPWLEKHNPNVDWKRRVLTFERCSCVTDIHPGRRQSSTTDERRTFCDTERQSPQELQIVSPSSTGAGLDPPDHKVRTKEGSHAPSEIPEEFKKWKRLFQEEEGLAALPRHQPWDHRIKLQPGKEPPWGPLYALSEKEQIAVVGEPEQAF